MTSGSVSSQTFVQPHSWAAFSRGGESLCRPCQGGQLGSRGNTPMTAEGAGRVPVPLSEPGRLATGSVPHLLLGSQALRCPMPASPYAPTPAPSQPLSCLLVFLPVPLGAQCPLLVQPASLPSAAARAPGADKAVHAPHCFAQACRDRLPLPGGHGGGPGRICREPHWEIAPLPLHCVALSFYKLAESSISSDSEWGRIGGELI